MARLGLAAEMVARVGLLLTAVRRAVRAAMQVMAETVLLIVVAQRLVRLVLAAVEVAAVVPGLILLKPVAVV